MPSIIEIISQEKHNADAIHLYKEGLFWKAYQQSAYRIDSQPCTAYKLTKKYIKAVGCEVVSLGFPSLNLTRHFREEQLDYIDDLHIRIQDKHIELPEYQDWFSQIPVFVPCPPKPKEPEYQTQIHIFEPAPQEHSSPSISDQIVNRLRNFRIEQSTPMQCMLFLSQLQKELS
jgi:hypothetical protein